MALILKTDFIDHTDKNHGMKSYKAGDDVSHLSGDVKKFLTDGGHVETKEVKEAKEPKESKK